MAVDLFERGDTRHMFRQGEIEEFPCVPFANVMPCIYPMAIRVDWDENKNRANIAKHGIELSIAMSVFDDPPFVTRLDPFPDEERFRTIGAAPDGILFVVHTIKELSGGRALLDYLSPIRNVSRKESI